MAISVTYTFSSGTTIDPDEVNQNFTDLANAAPDKAAAETISGSWEFSAVIKGPNGAVGAPAFTFSSDTDTGFYRIGADNIGLATNGVLRWDISTTAATYTLPVDITTNYMQFTERADPSAPAANNGLVYAKDSGAGKTQLVALFPTGAVQVIAEEP